MIRQRPYYTAYPQASSGGTSGPREERAEEGGTPARFTVNRAVAGVIWLAGCAATWQVMTTLGVRSWWRALCVAIVVQVVLTALERPLWCRGQLAQSGALLRYSRSDVDLALGALAIDVLFNAGGVWVWVRQLDQTTIWLMLRESLGLQGGMGGVPALILSLLIGYIVAKAPEQVWKW